MIQEHKLLARRIVRTLFAAQSLGSAGFISASTVSAIVAVDLSGGAAWSGVPSAAYQLGAAIAALGWGHASDRLGRRGALVSGLFIGVVGATLAILAVLTSAFALLLAGSLCLGAAQSGLTLGRFAAAEVHVAAERGRAISNVIVGGTIGSIFGPLLVGPMGQLARQIGMDELAGPFIASMLLFAIAMVIVWRWLRPDPRDLGREIARQLGPEGGSDLPARALGAILRLPGTALAMSAMVFGQLTMVMVMVMTSVHMHDHHHALPSISFVISSHTFGMFAFSILSGQLVDRWGRVPVIVFGAIALIIACVLAPLSPAVIPLAVSLFVLGLGWNFCFVGGSSLLADQLRPAERSRTQGFNDLLIGSVSAIGSLGSGIAFAFAGFAAMVAISGSFALIPLLVAVWIRRIEPSTTPA
jgi:MFS family permease